MSCKHKKFNANVTTVRDDGPPISFYVEVTNTCAECNIPFRFGHSFISSTDGRQLTAAIEPGLVEPNRPLAELNGAALLNGKKPKVKPKTKLKAKAKVKRNGHDYHHHV